MTTKHNQLAPGSTGEQPKPEAKPRIIKAEDLFQGRREVWLQLDGTRYRLRITGRNNLVLNK